MPEQRQTSRETGLAFALAQVGTEMVVPVGLAIWLAIRFEWGPWPVIGAAALGMVGGVSHLVLLLNRANKEDRASKEKP
jgi:hypothetical protein